MADLLDLIIGQITQMGVSGAVIAGLLCIVYKLWSALQSERQRTSTLADKLFELSKETAIMVERVSGR